MKNLSELGKPVIYAMRIAMTIFILLCLAGAFSLISLRTMGVSMNVIVMACFLFTAGYILYKRQLKEYWLAFIFLIVCTVMSIIVTVHIYGITAGIPK